MTFALRIKELREEKGLSQAKLAQALGIGVGSVGMWESTSEIPPVKKLLRISEFFNVSLDYLVGKSEVRKSLVAPQFTDADEQALLKLFRQLSSIERARALAYLEGMTSSEHSAHNRKG